MKRLPVYLIAVLLAVFIMESAAGFVIFDHMLFSDVVPDSYGTSDITSEGNAEDELVFVKPDSTPEITDDPNKTDDNGNPPSIDVNSTPAPGDPTPNPDSYYKNPYITLNNTTWVYDKIYKSNAATETNNSYNILVLVGDWSSGCTDSIIIANVNLDSGKITTLSVPRDTYVKLPNGVNGKINEIYYSYGINKLCDYIKGFTGIDINYYLMITGDTIKNLVDATGGVYYDVPVDIGPIGLKKGYQLLNGSQSVELLRFRNFYYSTDDVSDEQLAYYDGRDINRVKTAIKFIQAFAEQKFTLEHILNVNSYINILLKNADTNIKTETLLSILNFMMQHYSSITTGNNFMSYYLGGMYDDSKFYNASGKLMWVWEANDCVVNYNNNRAYYTKGIIDKMFRTKYLGLASY